MTRWNESLISMGLVSVQLHAIFDQIIDQDFLFTISAG